MPFEVRGHCFGLELVVSPLESAECFAAETAATATVPATGPSALKMVAPSFLCRPLAVSGMPIALETRDFAADIPNNLFHEKPPRFICVLR
jgi:hypothetical protein